MRDVHEGLVEPSPPAYMGSTEVAEESACETPRETGTEENNHIDIEGGEVERHCAGGSRGEKEGRGGGWGLREGCRERIHIPASRGVAVTKERWSEGREQKEVSRRVVT